MAALSERGYNFVADPTTGISIRNDARDINAEIRETGMIAEATVPALLVSGAVRLRITRRVAFW